MRYQNIRPAKFISRPNRFIAEIELDGKIEICHVKNTGRCKELLTPGAQIYVQEFDSNVRKTKYDLISVYKGERLINMDSQVPNKVFGECCGEIFKGMTLIRPECRYRNSRIDFYIESGARKIFAEVKGVTLEEEGVVLFPDAPTERGVKHLNELCACVEEGYEAYVAFVIQMKDVFYFTPNEKTHPAFGSALRHASKCGVQILALDCEVTPDTITARRRVDIKL